MAYADENRPFVEGMGYMLLLRWTKKGYIPVMGSVDPGSGQPIRYAPGAQAVAHVMWLLTQAGVSADVAAIAARQIRDRPDEPATIAPGVTVRIDMAVVMTAARAA